MLRFTMFRLQAIAAALLLVVAAGCDTSDGPSLWDPEASPGSTPSVAAISPEGSALAGIDEVTLTGSNFSATPGENLVLFGGTPGEIVSATPTELRVKVPNTPAENLPVRVSVQGSTSYSTPVSYTLVSAVTPFGELARTDEPFGMTSDSDGNLYVFLVIDGNAEGVFRITPEGERTLYHADALSIWPDIAFGADGVMYGVRNNRGVYRLPEGAPSSVFTALPNGNSFSAIATSPAGNLWVGGSNSVLSAAALYRIAPDGSSTAFPFPQVVRDIVIVEGALYAATQTSGTAQVWRFPLDGNDQLGTPEVIYNVTEALGSSVSLFTIEVASDGTVFAGTNASDPIRLIAPDGSEAPLYPGILTPPASKFAWGSGTTLYMGQARISETEVTQAQDAQLTQVITRYPRRP